MTASPSALPRICAWKLSQSLKGVPLKLTISSPGSMPGLRRRGRRVGRGAVARPASATGMTQAGTDGDRGLDDLVARVAVGREEDREQREGDGDVDHRAAGHHDHLLPPREAVEEPVGVVLLDVLPLRRAGVGDQLGEHPGVGAAHLVHRLAVLVVRRLLDEVLRARGQHPDDLDVAAERDGLDAVLGVADLLAPHRRAEADEPLRDLAAELLGRDEVTELVEPDRDQDRHDEGDDTQGVEQGGHAGRSFGCGAGRGAGRAQIRAADRGGLGTRPGVGGEDVVHGEVLPRWYVVGGQDLRNRGHDVGEAEPALVEGVDGDLVGGVVDRRGGAAPLPRRPGQGDGGEDLVVERLEAPVGRLRPVDRGLRVGHPVGPPHAERDRHQHRRQAQLGDHGAVDELDHRVDELLRVHDDVDAVEGDVEEQVRLDHLEALVDQRRGVGRDHPTHRRSWGGRAPARG